MKRKFFRTFVSGQAKVSVGKGADTDEVPSIEPDILKKTTGNKDVDNLINSLTDIVGNLDKKLNAIQDRLDETETSEDCLYNCETVDISGNGLRLMLPFEVEIGEILFISLDLFGCPKPRFEVYGKVVRLDAYDDLESTRYHAGIEFVNLDDRKREQLINFTFKQQRKYIRAFVDHPDKNFEETTR